ncbi:TIGR03986 family type III CRISPR-associated RAMP protein [Kineosporia babensis]|uniref:TIGR03986 family CRISPR-associated RAMP protein n=1 Tax=Kineosporia babensis TaxID=499548 RepID=A0A9X1NMJ7_9ACTN|nr:TIGR03986 family CRISPR-associated RAMP protein [Kineosporia babensis]MCD5316913.1 TIGR03986 family CRISPR-associated RAMP protein [Kineosporia babensis]
MIDKNMPPRVATAVHQGHHLTAAFSVSPDPATNIKERKLPQPKFSRPLAEWFANAEPGAQVQISVKLQISGNIEQVRLLAETILPEIPNDPQRMKALDAPGPDGTREGFVNPYTFVPTPERTSLQDSPATAAFADRAPNSHARITSGQWNGTITVTFTCRTPLLLPDTANSLQDSCKRTTYRTLTDHQGRPLLAPTSVKGAIRSAYETITASRYGVFTEPALPYAYRMPPGAALDLVPAVVQGEGDQRYFHLCPWPDRKPRTASITGSVLNAVWVPAYRDRKQQLRLLNGLSGQVLSDLHGRKVTARIRLMSRGKGSHFLLWQATHLSDSSPQALQRILSQESDDHLSKGKYQLENTEPPRFVEGILSVTGASIRTKHDERLFVLPSEGPPEIPLQPVTSEHQDFWNAILHAYRQAATYNTVPQGLARSRHIDQAEQLMNLPSGTPLYVTMNSNKITGVYPVMIGRIPYDNTPADILHPSLRPARLLSELSAADRVFGWVPTKGPDRSSKSSGYRGRLIVRSIVPNTDCTITELNHSTSKSDQVTAEPNEPGIVLSPLSSPKPTQFRFYTGATSGRPTAKAAPKATGYQNDSSLRGRKHYRWSSNLPDNHWDPTTETTETREYLDRTSTDDETSSTQTTRYLSWVAPQSSFTVQLRVDGIGTDELGALIWLLNQGSNAPLRLGPGKPLGFGVVETQIDWSTDQTQLWEVNAIKESWRTLGRPQPALPEKLKILANRFETQARSHPVLAEAVESYCRAVAPTDAAIHYPRPSPDRTNKIYEWFATNEKTTGGSKNNPIKVVHGWPLPHVREPDQRLPYHPFQDRK